jgi:hypothetical protein
VGEPPRRVSLAEVRRKVVRRRAARALSAGLAVVLACGLGVALSAGAARPGSGPTSGAHAPAGPPRYYVGSDSSGAHGSSLVVRATATGRVTATIRPPVAGAFCGESFAAAAGQTFFMPCSLPRTASRPYESVIYRFRVTAAGHVTGLAPVRGGVLKGMLIGDNIAAAPDGSEVAAEVLRTGHGPLYTNSVPAGILVISTRTGSHALWHSGPYVPGTVQFANGTDLSFTQDGSELVVLESRCHRDRTQSHCGTAPDNQVRAYSPAAHGGSLEAGRILLRESALRPRGTSAFDAFITPGGTALTALLSNCPPRGLCTQTVAQIPLSGGSDRVLYRVRAGTAFKGVLSRFFSTDPTARYLILDSQAGNSRVNGWISHGRLRLLTPSNGDDIGYETW